MTHRGADQERPRRSGAHTLVGVIPTVHSKGLIRELKRAGWTEDRCVGSHPIFEHPTIPGHITLPHPKKELGKGLALKIMKQAGLKR